MRLIYQKDINLLATNKCLAPSITTSLPYLIYAQFVRRCAVVVHDAPSSTTVARHVLVFYQLIPDRFCQNFIKKLRHQHSLSRTRKPLVIIMTLQPLTKVSAIVKPMRFFAFSCSGLNDLKGLLAKRGWILTDSKLDTIFQPICLLPYFRKNADR